MLSIHDVNRFMEHKKREHISTFEVLHERCKAYIMKYAENGKFRFFFEVPEFILGVPPYRLEDAVKYLLDRLLKAGYLVKYYFPKYMYISWSYDEIHKKNIVQKDVKFNMSSTTPSLPSSKVPIPKLSSTTQESLLPPPTMTRKSPSLIMPHMPSYDLPPPQNTMSSPTSTENIHNKYLQKTNFVKSIADYKPSGKFSLNI